MSAGPSDASRVPAASDAAAAGPEHVSAPTAYDAVLLAGFGGPEGQDEVIPFLRNVTRGRGVPEERLEEVAEHYRAFGGVSPINGQNRQLRAALEAELASRGVELPVLWGNRNWQPYLRETLAEAAAAGHTTLLAVTTSAYSSYSSCRQYREDLAVALAEAGLDGAIRIDKVRQYFDHPGFVEPFVEGVRSALAEFAAQGVSPQEIHVLFSTHSIPAMDAARSGPPEAGFGPGGAYVAQHLAVAEAVMEAAGAGAVGDADTPADAVDAPGPHAGGDLRPGRVQRDGIQWSLVYQSRSGPPSVPWLEPDVNDALAELAGQGVRAVVIVPLGFVSDHMEVQWDLDTEAVQTAAELGILAIRVPTPGVHPAFVSGLVDLILERRDGIPAAARPAKTALGPWYDVCRPECCENVRRGFKPALAGLAP